MTTTRTATYAKSSLALIATLTSLGLGAGFASSVDNYVSPHDASNAEDSARKAFAKHDFNKAISYGEQALAGAPRNADYRMLLGQANLSAGKFSSAETLFNDVLTLDPSNAQAALNLALTQIALDHATDARATLDAHRDQIAPADYGLAVALAGDTSTGIQVLVTAARASDATAKTRQNLALTYALAGQWDQSKAEASQDLAPDVVDKRMSDWAQMAHPKASWEQVATLLHVTPVNDPGLPYQLALQSDGNAPSLAAAQPSATPAPTSTAVAANDAQLTPRYETGAAATPIADTVPAPQALAPAVTPTAAPVIHAEAVPARHSIVASTHMKAQTAKPNYQVAFVHHAFHRGHFAVQLGAFASIAKAHVAWNANVRKLALLKHYDPAQSHFKFHAASYYRLAVTGFSTHAEAEKVCARLRSSGSGCFVRAVANDQLAEWVRPSANQPALAHAHMHAAKPVVTAQVPKAKPVKTAATTPAPKAKPVKATAAKPQLKTTTESLAASN